MKNNTMAVVGNITEPELRYTPSGKSVTTFSLALNERKKENGEWVDADPSWIRVVCWDRLADNTAASLTKGSRVVVLGRYKQRTWEGENGQTNYSSELLADVVAPSLEWAEASITKNPKSGGKPGSPPMEAYEDGGSATVNEPQAQFAGDYSYDEEPF